MICSASVADEVFIINVDGTNRTRLTICFNSGHFSERPAFSPDGTKILFANNDGIWFMNPDGTVKTSIPLAALIDNGQPNWQPIRP